MASLVGQVLLDQFRVEAFIASGGMGAVYRVWDLKRNVPLAMKVLHADLADDPSIFKRFQREARALQRLAHPNIVPFYGLFHAGDLAFLLERFIDGPSLKDILRQRKGSPMPVDEALIYLKAVSSALGYAHAHGVVHCDVKPGNVMVDRGGSIYLTDFGVARHAESTTTTLGFAGTAGYMAPEQVRGDPVSPATDVYALGVMLYEMLTGERPFRGDEQETEGKGSTGAERVRWAHLHLPPPDPRTKNPRLPERLAHVILKALAKEPGQRYAGVQELFVMASDTTGVREGTVPDRVKDLGRLVGPTPLIQLEATSASNKSGQAKGWGLKERVWLRGAAAVGAIALGLAVVLSLKPTLGLADRPRPGASTSAVGTTAVANGPLESYEEGTDVVATATALAHGRVANVSVSGTLGWQSSGVVVDQGDRVRIEYADGMWAGRVGFGPDLPDIWADAAGIDYLIYYPEIGIEANFASLIARVGNGPAIRVGNSNTFVADASGEIFLRIHDTDLHDNDGSITVQIQILP